MKKLNLSFVNFQQGPTEDNAYYLPYSAGILWSYAKSIPKIADNWQLGEIGWKRESIDSIYKRVADCDVLGLSTYVWNKNYNYTLAKKVKEYNPKIKIILGGPEVAILKPTLFQDIPWANAVVKKEGELVFADLLANIDSYQDIKGLCVNDNGHLIDTGNAVRIKEINNIPSPYISGVFDQIIKDNPTVNWNAILETSRGCPYQCTFCDWGSLTYSKVSKFDISRVFSELEWMSANKIDFVSVADANFGIFVERDNEIADRMVDIQKRSGYPKRYTFSWAKNQKAEVVKLVKKLYLNGMNNGLIVSTQSTTDVVLENIKRKNLESNRLAETFDLCSKEGVPVTTEMILGLPGETLESWKANIVNMLDLGLHTGMEMYVAQMLENAELNTSQKSEFHIQTKIMHDFVTGSKQDREILESIEVVVGTKDLPPDDFKAALLFNWYITLFHNSGVAQWFSRILRKKHNVGYLEFYNKLWDHLQSNTIFQKEKLVVEEAIKNYVNGDISLTEPIFGVHVDGFNLPYMGVMRMKAYELHQEYLSLVKSFVIKNYRSLLTDALINDIEKLSDAYMIKFSTRNKYPLELSFNHNIFGFLIHDKDLEQPCNNKFVFDENVNVDITSFLVHLYFRRRRSYGRAQIQEC